MADDSEQAPPAGEGPPQRLAMQNRPAAQSSRKLHAPPDAAGAAHVPSVTFGSYPTQWNPVAHAVSS